MIRLILFFLLFYLLWFFLAPVYNHVLAFPSVLILKLSEIGRTHITISMQVEGKYIFVHHVASEKNPDASQFARSNIGHDGDASRRLFLSYVFRFSRRPEQGCHSEPARRSCDSFATRSNVFDACPVRGRSISPDDCSYQSETLPAI